MAADDLTSRPTLVLFAENESLTQERFRMFVAVRADEESCDILTTPCKFLPVESPFVQGQSRAYLRGRALLRVLCEPGAVHLCQIGHVLTLEKSPVLVKIVLVLFSLEPIKHLSQDQQPRRTVIDDLHPSQICSPPTL